MFIAIASRPSRRQEFGEEWRLLGIQALLEMGRYTNALELLMASLDRYSSSVQMRLLGYEVLLRNATPNMPPMLLQEINVLAGGRAWAYRGPSDLVALGRTALLLGAEPRKVLEQFFDKAKRQIRNVVKPTSRAATWHWTKTILTWRRRFSPKA